MRRFFCLIAIFLVSTSTNAQEVDDLKNILSVEVTDVDDFLHDEDGFETNWDGLPSILVNDCVNVLTGSFCHHQTDLSFDGPIPFSLQRFYCSTDHRNGSLFHGWNHNFGGVLRMQTTKHHRYVVAKGKAGSELVYSGNRKDFNLYPVNEIYIKGLTNCQGPLISGRTNVKNNRLTRKNKNDYELTTGSGEIHYYHGYNDFFTLTLSTLPSQHSLRYNVEAQKIKKVELLNSLQQPINWFQLTFPSQKDLKTYIKEKKDLPKITLTTSDARTVEYALAAYSGQAGTKHDNTRFVISAVTRADAPCEEYFYHSPTSYQLEQIKRKQGPQGRFLEIDYYKDGRVKELRAPLGQGPEAVRMYSFKYNRDSKKDRGTGCTIVKDALQHQTIYRYNFELIHLDSIDRYTGTDKYTLYSKERYFWGLGRDLNHLISKTLEDANGTILYCHHYTYDDAGNIESERLYGNLTGTSNACIKFKRELYPINPDDSCECYQKQYTYSKDGLNLMLTCQEEGCSWEYQYKAGTSLLIARFLLENDQIKQREFFDYDENSALIESIHDDGNNRVKSSLSGVQERKIKRFTNSRDPKHVGLPEVVEELYLDLSDLQEKSLRKTVNHYGEWGGRITKQEVFDSTQANTPQYSLSWDYHPFGLPIKSVNAANEALIKDYDDNGNMIREFNPQSGVSTVYSYDYSNRLIRIEHILADESKLSEEFEYDYLGQKKSSTDIYKNKTYYHYDDFGRLIKIELPLVADENGKLSRPLIQKSYDEMGNETSVTDPRGNTMTTKYTIRGDPYERRYSDGTVEQFAYSLSGNLLAYTSRDGTKTEYKDYDYKSRPQRIEIYNRLGHLTAQISKKYSAFHLIQEIDAYGHVTHYSYDGAGRLAKIEKEDRLTTYSYDAFGRPVEKREFYGKGPDEYIATLSDYDFLDRLKKEIIQDSKGNIQRIVEYEYDAEGNRSLIRTYNQDGKAETSTLYNFQSQPIKTTDPLGAVTTTTYKCDYVDANGCTVPYVETTDPAGNVRIHISDAMGRKVHVEQRDASGKTIQKADFKYDLAGNVIQRIDTVISPQSEEREITTVFSYDSNNRVTYIIEAFGTPEQKVSARKYTPTGQLAVLVKPNGVKIKYDYDCFGRLLSCRASDHSLNYMYSYEMSRQPIVTIQDLIYHKAHVLKFDHNKELISETLSNGLEMRYAYDRLGRITMQYYPDQTSLQAIYAGIRLQELQRRDDKGVILFTQQHEAYDLAGNILSIGLPQACGRISYQYDLLNRPKQIEAKQWKTWGFDYDKRGDLQQRMVQDVCGEVACSYDYDGLHQLRSENGVANHAYVFDSLFNCVMKNGTEQRHNDLHQMLSSDNLERSFDCNGNLSTLHSATCKYDALDRLVRVSTPERRIDYRYDAFHRCVERTITEGSEADLVTKQKYLYTNFTEIGAADADHHMEELRLGIGDIFAIELKGRVYVPVHDFQGHVVTLLDGTSGDVVESYRYSAFGDESIYDGSGNVKTESINPWRYAGKRKDEQTGLINFGRRYYAPEQGRWISPDPMGFVDGMNLYAFLKNNPNRYYDPDGQFAFALALPLVSIGVEGAISLVTVTKIALTAAALYAGWELGHYVNQNITIEEAPTAEEEKKKKDNKHGIYAPDRPLPKDKYGIAIPDTDAPHVQLGTEAGSKGKYPKAREFNEKGDIVRDIEFTDHGRPVNHTNPHQHRRTDNKTGGTQTRIGAEPLPEWKYL